MDIDEAAVAENFDTMTLGELQLARDVAQARGLDARLAPIDAAIAVHHDALADSENPQNRLRAVMFRLRREGWSVSPVYDCAAGEQILSGLSVQAPR